MDYAELRCLTHYSFLRGASHPSELVDRAAELGLKALAITDRDGVYGIPKAYLAAREHSSLKLIVGAEVTIAGYPSLTLLATRRAGYGLLCRLLTASHADKPKGSAALEWAGFLQMLENFPSAAKELIAVPTPAILDPAIVSPPTPEYFEALREIFAGRCALPLIRVLDGKDSDRTRAVLDWSRRWDIPLIASNDVHFHVAARRPLQDCLTSIRCGVTLREAGWHLYSNAERYLKSPREMSELFKDLPETLRKTLQIAEQCDFSPSELRYRYPSEWIPAGDSAQSYLEKLTWKGARERYSPGEIPDDVVKQIQHELRLIEELGFADYFLTIWEIVDFARGRKILCQGRGSAANSAICYCLGITAIDPVRMNLLFERFLSVERGEPPDIDVDFEHERREEVIQYIYQKYGRDRAGMVAAVITYRTRSARRELAKVLELKAEHARVQEKVSELKGFPRHLSIHSGGFTLSADPLIETVPIEPARMEGRTIVQWDKNDLAALGLLKVDVLALGMLTAIRKAFDLIRPHGVDLDIATIPPDDAETYAMIQRAETVGVFQIESRAQMSMLGRLLPRNFYDLVIEVALVRPGPIQGQMVHPYLRRRRGLESPRSPDPRLEPILSRTLGVPLFQEQVMKMAIVMADFTPGEADELRRAIGAWRSSGSIEKMGRKLRSGFLKNGLPEEFVDRIFKQIQGFAEYGFPESHAASFALLVYASSYLKWHYPAEFACALLNSQPMGFYANHTILDEAKRQGVRVLPLHPFVSGWDHTLEGGAIRVGLRVVKGLGRKETDRFLAERSLRPFHTVADFVGRSGLSSRSMEQFAMGEAFACYGLNQRQALWKILELKFLTLQARQLSLFSLPEFQAAHSREALGQYRFAELRGYEAIRSDYESYGLSVRGHPMSALRLDENLKAPPTTTIAAKRAPNGRVLRLAGMIIVKQRPGTAKGTCFATMEDEEGFLDLIIHEATFEKYRETLLAHSFLTVSGKIQKDQNTVNMIVKSVQPLFNEEGVELHVPSYDFK